MSQWYAIQGRRVRARGIVQSFGTLAGNPSVTLQDVEIDEGGGWQYARDHVRIYGRSWCNPKRSTLQPGDIIEFTARVNCYTTLDDPRRRLGFKSVADVHLSGESA